MAQTVKFFKTSTLVVFNFFTETLNVNTTTYAQKRYNFATDARWEVELVANGDSMCKRVSRK